MSTIVIATNDGYIGENHQIVPCISLAKQYTSRYARTVARRNNGHAVDLEKGFCVITDTCHFATQQSYGKWNGRDLRLDYAAVMTKSRAIKLVGIFKSRERKLHRNWVIKPYAELMQERFGVLTA
jgi:hypothetical protein